MASGQVTEAQCEATAVSLQSQSGTDHALDSRGYYLLSLDGGGVRGLSTLYILEGIMNRLNYMRGEAGLAPRKPCEIFDLIGGTSTGGQETIPGNFAKISISNVDADSSPSC
jgi:hypothetical protein